MYGALCLNYHAKLPDLSRALSDVTLSVLVTKVPLVVAHQITKPTLHETHGTDLKNKLSQPFVPPPLPRKQRTALSLGK